jgi:CRP-like cAMP-binding protein
VAELAPQGSRHPGSRRRHKHDVIADTVCRVYILDGEGLARLSHGHPEIVRHIRDVARDREREIERAQRSARPACLRASRAKDMGETEA